MKKILFLFSTAFLLNGCIQSVALLGSSVGGASSGKMLQSSLQSTISYGIKKQTGKTPLGHALAYAEKNNPEREKETCLSFIEKTRSEFCTIAKKKISSTNRAIKEKVVSTKEKVVSTKEKVVSAVKMKTKSSIALVTVIKPKKEVAVKDPNRFNSFGQLKKSPRELAIVFQNELKNLKAKYTK